MKKLLLLSLLMSLMLGWTPCLCHSAAPLSKSAQQEEEEPGYVGLSGKFGLEPKHQRVTALLEEAVRLEASGRLEQIFSRMGRQEIGFKDLIAYKADYIGDIAAELREQGMEGIEADRKATEAWNKKFQHIERRMVQERQKTVKKVWHAALMEYMQRHPDSPVLKGDIGGWATEVFEKMSFASDIDFTLFAVQVADAAELRDLFEQKIKEHFGLDMRQFDAFCTAQRGATFDVYIDEWGAKWGEIDMIKRGKAEVYVLEGGVLKLRKLPAEQVLVMYHKMRKTLTEDTFKPTSDMEPGISMELYRHMEAEIVRGKFTTVDKIIKMSKYIDRSAESCGKLFGKAQTGPSRIAVLARRITEAKEKIKDPVKLAATVISLVDGMLGKGWANDPEKAINDIAQRGQREMISNINDGIKFHNDEIDKTADRKEKEKKRQWLEDVLTKERAAFEHDSVPFPDEASKTLERLTGVRAAQRFFGDKAADYIKVMTATKDGAKIAIASLIAKAEQNMDLVNDYLDFLDNSTVQRLRECDIPIQIVQGRRVLTRVSIASLNEGLNRSILGKIGNNAAFKAFNLLDEGYAYYNAYARASTQEEGLKNLANEVIMRRVPGSGITQAVVMENYVRAGLETVYLVFPPLAIPEAVLSLGQQVGSAGLGYGLGKYWESSLNEITENIYAFSLFKPVPGSKGAKWQLTHLGYKGRKYSRDALDKFFEAEEGWVGKVFSKAVDNDPVIVQLEKLKANEYVGERYRQRIEQLLETRRGECKKELLDQIIHTLEDRMAAEMLGQGVGAERMKEIRRDLECGESTLVPESGDGESSGEAYRQVMLEYQTHREAVGKIAELSEKTGVKLNHYKPVCSTDSLHRASEFNPRLVGRYKAMVDEIIKELKQIKGGFSWQDKDDKRDLASLLEFRKLVEPDLSNDPGGWKEKYAQELKKIKERYAVMIEDIEISSGGKEVFVGDEVGFEARIDLKEKAGVSYEWEASGVKFSNFSGKTSLKGKLETASAGTLDLVFRVKRGGDVIGERKKQVEILPEKSLVNIEEIVVTPDGEDLFEGDEIAFEARVQLKDNRGIAYQWEASGIKVSGFSGKSSLKGKLKAVSAGTLNLAFRVKKKGSVIGEAKKQVEILPVKLKSLTIEAEGKALLSEQNSKVQLKALAVYTNESTVDISAQAKWEVVKGDAVAVNGKGLVTLRKTRSFTPSGSAAEIAAGYQGKRATIEIQVQQGLSDLKAYWEMDPRLPVIPPASDPRGISVRFRAITDDPEHNDKRTFKWQFTKEDGSSEEKDGLEVSVFYREPGQFGVLLAVGDEWGNVDEEHDTVVIEEEHPEEAPEEKPVEEGKKEDATFKTPTGNANMYKGAMSGTKVLNVERYDWKTPLNSKAGFVPGASRQFVNVGYFNESACLKTGPIEKGTAFNPGYLVYYDEASKGIHYEVLGTGQQPGSSSIFVKEKLDYSHSGIIRESMGDIRKDSIKITEALPRGFRVSWTTADGKEQTALVWKYSDHGGYTFEGELASKPMDTFVKDVMSEVNDLLKGEGRESVDDQKLAAMIEEEIAKMTAEEEEAAAAKAQAAAEKVAEKPEVQPDKREVAKKVAERLQTGDASGALFVPGDGSVKHANRLDVKTRRVETEFDYRVVAVSTREVLVDEAFEYCKKNNIVPVLGPYTIIGRKHGDIINHANNPNLLKTLLDVWEIGVYFGKRTFINEKGQMFLELNYGQDAGKSQRYSGPFKFFNGMVWEMGNYVNGRQDGRVVLYDRLEGGRVLGQGSYRQNNRAGNWVYNGPGGPCTLVYDGAGGDPANAPPGVRFDDCWFGVFFW